MVKKIDYNGNTYRTINVLVVFVVSKSVQRKRIHNLMFRFMFKVNVPECLPVMDKQVWYPYSIGWHNHF